ncbi:MAG: amidohydrolase [Candidatus Pelethousia sp.]|nr:amidohydrolase [Candidatus Pelethousia sp.]
MPQAYDTLFENAQILTMVDACPAMEGCVGVRDGRIALVGPLPEGALAKRRIDCKGQILMPGLVNAHAHTPMCIMRGYADDYPLKTWLFEKVFPAEARLDERAVLAGARLGFAEQLCTGTTSVSDMYYHEPAIAAIALEAGMRVSLCNAVVALAPDWSMEKDRGIRETFSMLRDYQGAGDGLVQVEASIHAEYTSAPSVWRLVAELARKHGLGIQLHLSETRAEHEEAKARNGGKTPAYALAEQGVFEGRVTAAHCVWLEEADRALLAEKGVSAVHCPVSNLKLGSGVADVAAMRRAGINVALGTDGCCSNNTHDLFEEIKLAALLAKGKAFDPTVLSAYEALKMATVNGAQAQGRPDIGQVAEGMQADLIVLDLDHPTTRPSYDPFGAVVYSATGRSVRLTMVQGRILFEGGIFTTINLEKAYAEAEQYAKLRVLGEENK